MSEHVALFSLIKSNGAYSNLNHTWATRRQIYYTNVYIHFLAHELDIFITQAFIVYIYNIFEHVKRYMEKNRTWSPSMALSFYKNDLIFTKPIHKNKINNIC